MRARIAAVALGLLSSFVIAAEAQLIPFQQVPGSVEVVAYGVLDNENIPPNSPVGTKFANLSAKLSNGQPCPDCTYATVSSGYSADGGLCTYVGGYVSVKATGPGTAELDVLNAAALQYPIVYGGPPDNHGYACVSITPPGGKAYVHPFSLMVRGPTFLAFGPRYVSYDPQAVTPGTVLATLQAFIHADPTPGVAPTVRLGVDPACGDLVVSWPSLIVGSTNYSGVGTCHAQLTKTGVNTGMVGNSGATYNVSFIMSQAAYVGPGDVMPGWVRWNEPYAFSTASAVAQSPVWSVLREDHAPVFTMRTLPNGDADVIGLARNCDLVMCYMKTAFDESGHSPLNDLVAWNDLVGEKPYITNHRPAVFFDSFGSLPGYVHDNGSDRSMGNFTTYTGSGSSGLMTVVATDGDAYGGPLSITADYPGSRQWAQISFLHVSGVSFATGDGSGITAPGAAVGVGHDMIGVLNGASSLLKVDGTTYKGTLLATASMAKPFGIGATFGGGGHDGPVAGGGEMNLVPSTAQLQALCAIHQAEYGTGGSCLN